MFLIDLCQLFKISSYIWEIFMLFETALMKASSKRCTEITKIHKTTTK